MICEICCTDRPPVWFIRRGAYDGVQVCNSCIAEYYEEE